SYPGPPARFANSSSCRAAAVVARDTRRQIVIEQAYCCREAIGLRDRIMRRIERQVRATPDSVLPQIAPEELKLLCFRRNEYDIGEIVRFKRVGTIVAISFDSVFMSDDQLV